MSLKLALATVPGAALGAYIASHMQTDNFQRLLSVVLVLAVIALFLPSPKAPETERFSPVRRALAYPALFGVGFIFMAGLQRLLQVELVRVNMHKVFIVFCYTLPALAVFLWRGQVNWVLGPALAAGAATWTATHLAVRGGEKWIRLVVALAVVLMAIKLLISAG